MARGLHARKICKFQGACTTCRYLQISPDISRYSPGIYRVYLLVFSTGQGLHYVQAPPGILPANAGYIFWYFLLGKACSTRKYLPVFSKHLPASPGYIFWYFLRDRGCTTCRHLPIIDRLSIEGTPPCVPRTPSGIFSSVFSI